MQQHISPVSSDAELLSDKFELIHVPASSVARRVLLIASDTTSRHLARDDRQTRILFGDAAEALVILPKAAAQPWNAPSPRNGRAGTVCMEGRPLSSFQVGFFGGPQRGLSCDGRTHPSRPAIGPSKRRTFTTPSSRSSTLIAVARGAVNKIPL